MIVKYPDRGLVENGSVSPLFETLYLVMSVTLLSVFSLFGFYYYLNRDPDKISKFQLMCRRQEVDWSNFDAMKSISLILALTFPLLMILISMYIAILYFLRSRGIIQKGDKFKIKRVPSIIGNYRRNILSLRETFAYMIFFFFNFYLNSFMLKFHNRFGFSIDMIRIYGFSSSLVVNNFLEGIVWPLFILWNLNKKMPEFYSNLKVRAKYKQTFFIIGNQNIAPRRIYESKETIFSREKNFTKSSTCFNFLDLTNQQYHSVLDLPSVV